MFVVADASESSALLCSCPPLTCASQSRPYTKDVVVAMQMRIDALEYELAALHVSTGSTPLPTGVQFYGGPALAPRYVPPLLHWPLLTSITATSLKTPSKVRSPPLPHLSNRPTRRPRTQHPRRTTLLRSHLVLPHHDRRLVLHPPLQSHRSPSLLPHSRADPHRHPGGPGPPETTTGTRGGIQESRC